METSVRHDGLKMQGSKNKVGGQKKTRWGVKKKQGGRSKKQGGVKKTRWGSKQKLGNQKNKGG